MPAPPRLPALTAALVTLLPVPGYAESAQTSAFALTTMETLILAALALALVVMIWVIAHDINQRDKEMEAKASPNALDLVQMPRAARFLLMALAGLAALVAFVVLITCREGCQNSNGFIWVAALILIGIAAFTGIMSLLSRAAYRIGMIDGRHPFGLPEGSIRAILTMAFIVLVGVLSAFLITSYNDRSPFAATSLLLAVETDRQAAQSLRQQLQTQLGSDALVVLQEARQGTDTIWQVAAFPKVDNSMADDVAKQTLTMISTILAAMIGFYFAERSGAANAGDPVAAGDKERRAVLRSLVNDVGQMTEQLQQRLQAQTSRMTTLSADSPDRKAAETERDGMEKVIAESDPLLQRAKTLLDDPKTTLQQLTELIRSLEATRSNFAAFKP